MPIIKANKSEDNKYFTPSIEDIRVGYEYELCTTHPEEADNSHWSRHLFPDPFVGYRLDGFKKSIEMGIIRVPYLTKEQIEAEGYPIIGIYPSGGSLHKKDLYELVFLTDYRLIITKVWKSFEGEPDEKTHRKDIYNGECKCINNFRYINKLLGI